jgi:Cys-tRNA(Pro)/Cys-tRNA(Cys) deacylase
VTPAIAASERAGIAVRVHTYPPPSTAVGYGAHAATQLGVQEDRIFKTLIVDVESRGLVVVVVPVAATLDLKALATVAGGKRAELAAPSAAERATGYVTGGISPLGQRQRLPTYLDESAMRFETVHVSGGKRGLDIELAPQDLLDVAQAELARIGH